MEKAQLQRKIIQQLESQWRIAYDSAQRAAEAATDEETIPEHKYDTLAIEAAYLAHGQAMRLQSIQDHIQQYKKLTFRASEDQKVTLGAYVEVVDEWEQEKAFFIGPCCGGLKIVWQDKRVFVLTPESPLGKALLGKQLGDEVDVTLANQRQVYEIVTLN